MWQFFAIFHYPYTSLYCGIIMIPGKKIPQLPSLPIGCTSWEPFYVFVDQTVLILEK